MLILNHSEIKAYISHGIGRKAILGAQYQQWGEVRAYAAVYYSSVTPAARPPLLSITVCPRGKIGNESAHTVGWRVCVCVSVQSIW